MTPEQFLEKYKTGEYHAKEYAGTTSTNNHVYYIVASDGLAASATFWQARVTMIVYDDERPVEYDCEQPYKVEAQTITTVKWVPVGVEA